MKCKGVASQVGKEEKRKRERQRERLRKTEREIVYSCFERREPGSKISRSLWGLCIIVVAFLVPERETPEVLLTTGLGLNKTCRS